jgi:hypothetical protein
LCQYYQWKFAGFQFIPGANNNFLVQTYRKTPCSLPLFYQDIKLMNGWINFPSRKVEQYEFQLWWIFGISHVTRAGGQEDSE